MEIHGVPPCPGCGGAMRVAALRCPRCETEVRGEFRPPLSGLSIAHQQFVERYLRARGNLKELEREIGVAYQTLRGQLDEIVEVLGGAGVRREEREVGISSSGDVLTRLRRGEIRAEDALRLLETRPLDEEPDGEGER